MKTRFSKWLWAPAVLGAAVALVLLTTPPHTEVAQAQAQPVALTYYVPVIVNIYPNSGISGDDEAAKKEIQEAIDEANGILEQAGITLRVVKVNRIGANSGGANHWGGDDGTAGGTPGDGDLTDLPGPNNDEGEKVQTFGGKELRNPQNIPNKRGLKIAFVNTPIVGSGTPGWAVHRDPTIIVKKRATAAGPQGTGATIAHEFGHVLTIKQHSNDPNNFMAPSDLPRTDTNMTQEQINKMTARTGFLGLGGREISSRSKCATQFSRDFPAVKCATQFGGTTDGRGDQSGSTPSAIYDLHQVFLNSLHPTDQSGGDVNNIIAQITVSGVLPTGEDINATYALGFNSDNSGTGVTYAGYEGIDRIVYVNAAGNIGLGTFDLSGAVLDPISNTLSSLPEKPVVETEDEFPDFDAPAVPVATSFLAKIPKNLLNLSDAELPVVGAAGLLGSPSDFSDDVLYDVTEDLFFDSLSFLRDPTLTTFDNGVPIPGQPYMFSVSGLEPNDTFNLYLDDQLVSTGVLDGTGTSTGSFVFPTDVPIGDVHFLTAQDSTGEFAYSMTCPQPPKVGGAAQDLPDITGAPLEAPDSSGGNHGALVGLIAVVTAGVVALGGAAWYVRRRQIR